MVSDWKIAGAAAVLAIAITFLLVAPYFRPLPDYAYKYGEIERKLDICRNIDGCNSFLVAPSKEGYPKAVLIDFRGPETAIRVTRYYKDRNEYSSVSYLCKNNECAILFPIYDGSEIYVSAENNKLFDPSDLVKTYSFWEFFTKRMPVMSKHLFMYYGYYFRAFYRKTHPSLIHISRDIERLVPISDSPLSEYHSLIDSAILSHDPNFCLFLDAPNDRNSCIIEYCIVRPENCLDYLMSNTQKYDPGVVSKIKYFIYSNEDCNALETDIDVQECLHTRFLTSFPW